MRKVKWGVIGVAKIATEKVIPAMQQGEVSEIAAIASRDLEKAKTAAKTLNIPRAYGSYEGCWPIRRSRRSTIRCPMRGMCRGR